MTRPAALCFSFATSIRRYGVAALVCAATLAPLDMAGADGNTGVRRRQELIRMVRQDCGSCHGMTLKGGLGPPLTPEALRDKPAESLIATILHGRPGTPMPPWGRFLDADEAHWIVSELLRGFPQE